MFKALLGSVLVFCLGAQPVNADAVYRIELAADNTMSSCAIVGDGSGLISVHMFMIGTEATTGVQFAAYIPSCWAGVTWLGDVLSEPWLTLGTTQDAGGLSIAFTVCRPLPIYLGAINFFGVASGTCCEFPVTRPMTLSTKYPAWATVLGVDCSFEGYPGTGGRVLVNANESCPCEQPLAVEESTWGRVKALYR